MKVLKYVGKGEWEEVDESLVSATDRILQIRKHRLSSLDKEQRFMNDLFAGTEKNGYRTIKVSALLKRFGFGRRTPKNEEYIRKIFLENGYTCHPHYSNKLKVSDVVKVYKYPVAQYGELFKDENKLEEYVFKNGLLTTILGFEKVIKQHSPLGSKDRLDFKGVSDDGGVAVIELKNKGGGKRAIEQLLRYNALVSQEEAGKAIRLILVTGIQDYDTALAIRGMEPKQRAKLEWYVYQYRSSEDHFSLNKVANEEIQNQTNVLEQE